jgi:hypothetical protein
LPHTHCGDAVMIKGRIKCSTFNSFAQHKSHKLITVNVITIHFVWCYIKVEVINKHVQCLSRRTVSLNAEMKTLRRLTNRQVESAQHLPTGGNTRAEAFQSGIGNHSGFVWIQRIINTQCITKVSAKSYEVNVVSMFTVNSCSWEAHTENVNVFISEIRSDGEGCSFICILQWAQDGKSRYIVGNKG